MGTTPTSLKVLGILGIIYGVLKLLGTLWALVQLFQPFGANPITDSLLHDHLYLGVTITSSILGFCLGILLLVSSIGCLKAKHSARTGMNAYAVIEALLSIAGTIFAVVYAVPRMDFAKAIPAGGGPAPPAELMQTIVMASVVVGLLIVLGIVTTILIMVNRKIAVDAFNGIFPASSTDFPVDFPPPPLPQ